MITFNKSPFDSNFQVNIIKSILDDYKIRLGMLLFKI